MAKRNTSKTPNRQQRSRRTTKRQRTRRKNPLRIILVIIAAVITLLCLLMVILGVFGAFRRASSEGRLYFSHQQDRLAIHRQLDSVAGTEFGTAVYRLWDLSGGKPSTLHGSYTFPTGMTALEVAIKLRRGLQTPVTLTWNNVRTLSDLSRRLGSRIDADTNAFREAMIEFASKKGVDTVQVMALFIPDTYQVYWTSTPQRVIDKLHRAYQRFWTHQRIASANALGLDSMQVSILASIVEEETARPDEYGKIARLYLNRLKSGMPLQADPTVKFAVGDPSLRRITHKHLSTESPYNTYKHKGLPPGPLRMPSTLAIDAVLQAPDHGYLYMCAREDFSGYHNFATSYDTHMANAAKYQTELNRRGIK